MTCYLATDHAWNVNGQVFHVYGGIVSLQDMTVVVLGAGGASRAIITALLLLGAAQVILVNRTVEKTHTLVSAFGARVVASPWDSLPECLPKSQLLVNTTSLGMAGQSALEIDLAPMPKGAAVVDIVYRPLVTPLLEQAKARGLKAIDGLGMLLHQAQPGFAAWFGVEPRVTEELRAHLVDLMKAQG